MKRMAQLYMIVDVAHAHPAMVNDILNLPHGDRTFICT